MAVVDVSSALRDLILDHAPNSDTFQKHYLNRNVCADLWAVHRDLHPQQALISQATSHGGSRDSRRVFKLTDSQIEEVKQDRRYARLTQAIESHRDRTSAARKELTRQRKNLFARLKDNKLRKVREEWTEKQAVEDVARQMQGEDITMDDSAVVNNTRLMTDIQRMMFDALNEPLVSNIEAQFQRRTDAIVALMAYCGEEEPLRTKVLEAREPKPPPELQQQDLIAEEQLEEILRSVFVRVMGSKVRRCFICVFKARMLGRTHFRFNSLCRSFYDPKVLATHFTSVHLDKMAPHDRFDCPNCQVTLLDKNHFRLHAEEVHGIKTSRKRKMRYTGE